jgi:hypothetical protein
MTRDTDESKFGLLACGSSGRWTVDLDESRDGTKWSMQLDGPQTYISFAVDDLAVIGNALTYLRSGGSRDSQLVLGRFGSAHVSLFWDNEDGGRCFLIVGPQAGSALRVSLYREDTAMLAEALEQILNDLRPEAGVAQ